MSIAYKPRGYYPKRETLLVKSKSQSKFNPSSFPMGDSNEIAQLMKMMERIHAGMDEVKRRWN